MRLSSECACLPTIRRDRVRRILHAPQSGLRRFRCVHDRLRARRGGVGDCGPGRSGGVAIRRGGGSTPFCLLIDSA